MSEIKLESKATIRARERGYFNTSPDWHAQFTYTKLTGDIGYTKGVTRRDPTSVIKVDGKYYVWYTKSVGETQGFIEGKPDLKVFPWDYSEIWYAESEDGYDWKELGLAVGRGEKGSYDDRSVFTPEILVHDGKFYLVYQVVKSPYVVRVQEHIAMAVSDSVHGPFEKLDEPIVYASNTGEWEGDSDDRFKIKSKGEFDSHKVHDPSLHYFNNKFYLYYKGETKGESVFGGGREIKWGVAIADNILGPYVKSPYNPISNSGHETCMWEYDGGIVAMLTSDGFEKNTIQYAKDGVNFDIMGTICRLEVPPHAAGPFREQGAVFKHPIQGITWGLHMVAGDWNYIERFDLNETVKNRIKN
ncbi:MAG: family 43 glycosylhydrolase [Clostridia bacterium]